MEKNKNIITESINDVFRSFSISINLTVYGIYLLFLIFCACFDIGLLFVNIILALATAAFMGFYLTLRLSSKKKDKRIKQIKRYYRRIKLGARMLTLFTAVYALISAANSTSPMAIIFALMGAVFIAISLLVEIFLYFISQKVKLIKDHIQSKIKSVEDVIDTIDDEVNYYSERRARYRRTDDKRKRRKDDIFVSVEDCVLSDLEDF